MKNWDLSPLGECKEQYANLVDDVEKAYGCEWDDAIHDSYALYIKDIQNILREIEGICCDANEIGAKMSSIDIDYLKKITGALCREADAI